MRTWRRTELPFGMLDCCGGIEQSARMWARIKWAASRVSRQGAAQELSLLILSNDLDGAGWRVLDQRAWKTGLDNTNGWAVRARDAGLLTVWRSFEQSGSQRWLWVQVSRLASRSDADEALRVVPERLLRNLRAEVTVTKEFDVTPPRLDGASDVWAHEQQTSGPKGDGVALYAAFVVDQCVVMTSASAFADQWQWSDLARVAQRQIDLLRASRN